LASDEADPDSEICEAVDSGAPAIWGFEISVTVVKSR
jgi:hypothetical protein